MEEAISLDKEEKMLFEKRARKRLAGMLLCFALAFMSVLLAPVLGPGLAKALAATAILTNFVFLISGLRYFVMLWRE